MSSLSVVVPVWNGREHSLRCLRSVLAALEGHGGAELIVVDDGSTDGVAEVIESELDGVRLLRNGENLGFARSANRGMAAARGERLLLLNSDTVLERGALQSLMEHLDRNPDCPGVAPGLVGEDGATQRACMAFPRAWTPIFFASPGW